MNIVERDNNHISFASQVITVDRNGKLYVNNEEIEASTKKDDDSNDTYRCLPYELGQVTMDGGYKTNLIYKIVYLAFSGENKPIVHHKFGNTTNDSIDNLVGCDTKEEHDLYGVLEKLYILFNENYEIHNAKGYFIKDRILPYYNYKVLQDLERISFISGEYIPTEVKEICDRIRYNGNINTTTELMEELMKNNIQFDVFIHALSDLHNGNYTKDKTYYRLDISFNKEKE